MCACEYVCVRLSTVPAIVAVIITPATAFAHSNAIPLLLFTLSSLGNVIYWFRRHISSCFTLLTLVNWVYARARDPTAKKENKKNVSILRRCSNLLVCVCGTTAFSLIIGMSTAYTLRVPRFIHCDNGMTWPAINDVSVWSFPMLLHSLMTINSGDKNGSDRNETHSSSRDLSSQNHMMILDLLNSERKVSLRVFWATVGSNRIRNEDARQRSAVSYPELSP